MNEQQAKKMHDVIIERWGGHHRPARFIGHSQVSSVLPHCSTTRFASPQPLSTQILEIRYLKDKAEIVYRRDGFSFLAATSPPTYAGEGWCSEFVSYSNPKMLDKIQELIEFVYQ